MSKEEISKEEQPLCSHVINEIPVKLEPIIQEKYKYSEEEQIAIERLTRKANGETVFAIFYNQEQMDKDIQTVLNLIEKQQIEIEEQKFKRSFKNGEISVEHNGVKYIREDFVISKEKIRKIIETRPSDLAIFKIINLLGETDDR